jgi:hypothetical protein
MKKLILIISLILSFNLMANCRPIIEETLSHKILSSAKVDKAGKITTGAVFITVGGFYGTMGVIMTGPLWAGAIIGGTFGLAAALPVGTTFFIIHKVHQKKIKNLGNTLSIVNQGESFDLLLSEIHQYYPHVSRELLIQEINHINDNGTLCDGTVAKGFRKIASPRDLRNYFLNLFATQF